nr:unnamed protein product [Callosobruchus analis]
MKTTWSEAKRYDCGFIGAHQLFFQIKNAPYERPSTVECPTSFEAGAAAASDQVTQTPIVQGRIRFRESGCVSLSSENDALASASRAYGLNLSLRKFCTSRSAPQAIACALQLHMHFSSSDSQYGFYWGRRAGRGRLSIADQLLLREVNDHTSVTFLTADEPSSNFPISNSTCETTMHKSKGRKTGLFIATSAAKVSPRSQVLGRIRRKLGFPGKHITPKRNCASLLLEP